MLIPLWETPVLCPVGYPFTTCGRLRILVSHHFRGQPKPRRISQTFRLGGLSAAFSKTRTKRSGASAVDRALILSDSGTRVVW